MGTQTNPELEARIHANLDDRDAYLVYGDWLSERGDPRGELIAVQVKLEQQPNAELSVRQAKLLDENQAAWLGDLGNLDKEIDFEAVWRWGFIDSVRIGPTDGYDTSELDFPDTIEKAMQLPAIGFLRELVIGALSDDHPTSWSDCIAKLAETGVPKTLRRLEFTRGGYWDISSTMLGDLSPLYPHLANLRELRIELGSMGLGATMNLPALEKLDLYTGGLTSDNMKAINSARWPALETLSLCIGETGNYYGCDVQFADLEPIFAAEHQPNVKHLALANSSLADQIAAALPDSRILPRLETLDLSRGTLSDEGAQAILDHWDGFAHLKTIDLSHAYLSAGVAAQLLAKGTVALADPRDAEQDRCCEISE